MSQTLVDFNNYVSASNNDLTNKFIGDHGLHQITTGGTTGGSIEIDSDTEFDEVSIANFAIYKDTISITGKSIKLSIDFRYVPPAILTDKNSVTLKIQTLDMLDGNMSDFLNLTYIADENELWGRSNAHWPTTGLLPDISGNRWYRLELNMAKNAMELANDTVIFEGKLYDIGISGTSAPTTLTTLSYVMSSMYDFFNENKKILVGVTANASTGITNLDNFNVSATFDNPTSLAEIKKSLKIEMPSYISGCSIPVTNPEALEVMYYIYDVYGRTIKNGRLQGNENIDVSNMQTGNFVATFRTKHGQSASKKFVIVR